MGNKKFFHDLLEISNDGTSSSTKIFFKKKLSGKKKKKEERHLQEGASSPDTLISLQFSLPQPHSTTWPCGYE